MSYPSATIYPGRVLFPGLPFSGRAPVARSTSADIPATDLTTDLTTEAGRAPFDAHVIGVSYIPNADTIGDDTDSRSLTLLNQGADGQGTQVVAQYMLITGHDLTAGDEQPFALVTTEVAEGDEFAFLSVHQGSGLADPGGLCQITFERR